MKLEIFVFGPSVFRHNLSCLGGRLTIKTLCLFLLVMTCISSLTLSAADAAGVWQGELFMTGGRGEERMQVVLTLAMNGSTLTGTMNSNGETAELLDGSVKGDEVSFAITSGADDVPRFEFHGSITGDVLTFTVSGRLKDTGQILRIGEGSFKRSK